jgi:hypothetical protein
VAKIKNVSGEDRTVPWLGGRLVLAGAVVEVEADQVTAFTQQEQTWAPSDKEAQKLHDDMLKGIAELRSGESGTPIAEVAVEDTVATRTDNEES